MYIFVADAFVVIRLAFTEHLLHQCLLPREQSLDIIFWNTLILINNFADIEIHSFSQLSMWTRGRIREDYGGYAGQYV